MEDTSTFIKRKLAEFVREQREKAGFTGDKQIHGYTFDELEANASTIGASTLFAIFEEFFNPQDTHR